MLAHEITRRTTQQAGAANDNLALRRWGDFVKEARDFQRAPANQNTSRAALSQIGRSRVTGALRRIGRFGRNAAYVFIAEEVLRHTLWQAGHPAGYYNLDKGGWSKYAECPDGPDGTVFRYLASTSSEPVKNFINACLGGQGYTDAMLANGAEGDAFSGLADNILSVVIASVTNPTLRRCKMLEGYHRPSTGPVIEPDYAATAAATIALAQAAAIPAEVIDAMAQDAALRPVVEPIPEFLPPAKTHDKRRRPPHIEGDYHAAGVRPQYSPLSEMGIDYRVVIASKPAAAAASGGHRREPPKGKTKETKIRVSPAMIPVLKAINALTETVDFIEAVHKSLPEEFQARYRNTAYRATNPTPQQMLRAIVENWHHIAPEDLLYNLLSEHIEDKIFGKIGSLNAETSKRLGLHYGAGLNTLTTQVRYLTSKYEFSNEERE